MLKKPHYIALAIVGLLTVIFLSLPHHTANQIKLAVGGVFLPLLGLSKSYQELSTRVGNAVVPRSELIRQNELLSHSNEVYRIRAMQAEDVFRENERLRQLLNWHQGSPQSAWNLKLARVVGHDPANWWHTLQIDLGSRNGVQVNMAVLVPDGFVGRVTSVGLTTSQVTLIGDPNCKVAVAVESGKNPEFGVVTGGAGSIGDSLVTVSYLSGTNNFKPGQMVRTSGQGGLIRAGIVVGQVVEQAHEVELGYAEVRVKLAVNLNSLDEVWVLMQ